MRPLGNLLVLAGIGKGFYNRWRAQRLVSAALMIVGLVWVTSILASMLLVGGFYAAYLGLLHYQVEPVNAAFIVAVAAIALMAAMVAATKNYIEQLLKRSPATTQVGETVDAFLDGLLAE